LKDYGFEAKILSAVESVNHLQRDYFVEKVVRQMGENLSGKTFAVWGLAFKPQTDDMREAPSIDIIKGLRDHGASFKAYDPIAVENARKIIGDEKIEYVPNNYDALKDVDALLLLTEWHHFRKPDFDKMKSLMKTPVIFDGRNQYEPDKMKAMGFSYFSIGRN
jgi:UDPglucose 6-dehydrogenase